MIFMAGVTVDNKGKEKLLRTEIEILQNKNTFLENQLKAKMEEIEALIAKIHKMGGRIKK